MITPKANEVICDMLTGILVREMMKTGEHLNVAQTRLLKAPHIEEAVEWLSNNGGCTSDAHADWVNIYRKSVKGGR